MLCHIVAVFLKAEIELWMSEDPANLITNTLLHDLPNLGQWLSNRVRNYVQTRHKDVSAHMGVPREWQIWFHNEKPLKERLHKQFNATLWAGDDPSVCLFLKKNFATNQHQFLTIMLISYIYVANDILNHFLTFCTNQHQILTLRFFF